MSRQCGQCYEYKNGHEFSSNQWRKGDGSSRCKTCVGAVFGCNECSRTFSGQNALRMHMQVHRSKNVACPVCGDRRFGSGANAVMHLESGYCSGCTGAENARQQIYKFASQQSAMQPFMSHVPQLTYGGYDSGSVPDLPYSCAQCSKSFRHLSQLMQHQDQKHNNTNMLTY